MTEITKQTNDGTNFHLQNYDTSTTTTTTSHVSTPVTVSGYDTGDTIGAALFGSELEGVPNSGPHHPFLPMPSEDDNDPTPTSTLLTPSQQSQVMNEYAQLLNENFDSAVASLAPPLTNEQQQALLTALQTNTPPTDPTLASLFNGIVQTTQLSIQTQFLLPSTWNIGVATNPQSDTWVTTPHGPFTSSEQETINVAYNTQFAAEMNIAIASADPPLSETDKAALMLALQSGGPVEGDAQVVSDIYFAVKGQTLSNLQSQFFLPEGWSPGMDVNDTTGWQPIGTSSLNGPAATGLTITSQTLTNALNLAHNAENAAMKLVSSLPADSTRSILMADFLKAVASAISTLKAALQNLQAIDAQLQDKLTAAKYSELEGRRATGERLLAKNDEQVQKAMDAANSQSKMSGIMKILGPLVAAISSIIGAVLSIAGGAGVAIIAAGIAVGMAMTAYSIADGQLGLTAKFMKAFTAFLSDLGSPMKYIAMAGFALAAAALIAVLTVLSPGTTITAAAQTGLQAAATAVCTTVQQLTTQMVIMMLAASNILADIIGPIVAKMGGGKIAQMIASAVAMLVLIALASKGGNAGSAVKSGAQTIGQRATDTLASITKSLNEFKSTISSLKNISDAVKSSIMEVFKNIMEIPRSLLSLRGVQVLLQASPLAVSIADNVIQGIAALAISQILKEIGTLQAEMDLLKEMIKMLTKLIDKIMNAMGGPVQEIDKLVKFVMGLFDKLDAVLSKVDRAGIPT
jgi:invasin B